MDLLELEAGVNPNTHWYYQSKKVPLINFAEKILQTINQLTIIDVGAGSGFFSYELDKKFGDRIKKIYLVDINYTQQEMQLTKSQKIEKVTHVPEDIKDGLYILMDVLEHLENDLSMLDVIKKSSRGHSNYFFITVPAFMSLWSGHDNYLGHYRRYKIESLKKLLTNANYTIKNINYLYGMLFPLVWILRKIGNLTNKKIESNMKPTNAILNQILLKSIAFEMRFATFNKLFGVSCSALGKI